MDFVEGREGKVRGRQEVGRRRIYNDALAFKISVVS